MKALCLCCILSAFSARALYAGALDQLGGGGSAPVSVSAPSPSASFASAEDYALPSEPMPETEYYRVRPAWEPPPAGSKSAAAEIEDKSEIPFLMQATAESNAQSVDLSLILAVIKKESSFNKRAQSSVGAQGLMQLMPDTAKWLGLKDASKIFDPAVNIKYGTKLIRYLWGQFGESDLANLDSAAMELKSTRMAIAAYNAGAGNVRKYDDVPPFKETKDYVKKVTAYFSDFETLLAAP